MGLSDKPLKNNSLDYSYYHFVFLFKHSILENLRMQSAVLFLIHFFMDLTKVLVIWSH